MLLRALFAMILALGAAGLTVVEARQPSPIPHCAPCPDAR